MLRPPTARPADSGVTVTTSSRPTGVDQTQVGRVVPPTETYVVSAAKIEEMARATGATSPLHTDREAARAAGYPDVVAPATFAVIIAQRAEAAYVADPSSGIDFSRVVHAQETFSYARPLVAGDEIRTTVHVDAITERAGLTFVTTRAELADAAGETVAVVGSTLGVRGEGR